MKILFAILLCALFVYEAECAPIIRGVAPNSAAPGETLTIRIVAENISSC